MKDNVGWRVTRPLAMSWFNFTLGVLATWRLTHLLVAEDGPWDALMRFRKALSKNIAGRLLDCFYCSTLWVSILFCLLLAQTLKDRFISWLAFSAAAILLENLSARIGEPAAATYVEGGDQNHELLRENQRHGEKAE